MSKNGALPERADPLDWERLQELRDQRDQAGRAVQQARQALEEAVRRFERACGALEGHMEYLARRCELDTAADAFDPDGTIRRGALS